jgi:cation-transporting ATPase E
MVPVGLVLLTTIAFALGALRLARRKVFVQSLPAIEGLATRVTVSVTKADGTQHSVSVLLEDLASS